MAFQLRRLVGPAEATASGPKQERLRPICGAARNAPSAWLDSERALSQLGWSFDNDARTLG
jgi:hypothetical protein